MADAKAPAEQGEPLFSTARLELIIPDSAKPEVKEFTLDPEVARIFTARGQVSAVTKTFGPFAGGILLPNGERVCTLDDVFVTGTRGTSPQGEGFILLTLEQLVTSHGWRAGKGTGGEPWGAPQEVRCQNSAGGTMYVTSFGTAGVFKMECGDRRRYYRVQYAERYFLNWFDAWTGYTQYIEGTFFRC